MAQKETALAPRFDRDPFAMLRQMRAEMDRVFQDPFWPRIEWPAVPEKELAAWTPKIEVFEKDNRLVTRIDLPGMKKEDVKVEATDGRLAISGERKRESEEKKENVYRSEREYGSFYRSVPLPDGVKFDDVKATFANGVLEVSVPMPKAPAAAVRKIEIEEAPKSKSAA
jgi:HSP20 family protein